MRQRNLSKVPESVFSDASRESQSTNGLVDSIAKRIVAAIPENEPGILSDERNSLKSDTIVNEGFRLHALWQALEKVSCSGISEDEYRLLLDYGCVYAQGEHLRKRVTDELAWFSMKKSILDGAAGFFGFMKRMNLEWSPIAHWFDTEYPQAFPDGTFPYWGYDHFQTTEAVNERIELLRNPDFGNPERPLQTIRAKEWRLRLRDLSDRIGERRAESGEVADYSDLSDAGEIWLPPSVIAEFAVVTESKDSN